MTTAPKKSADHVAFLESYSSRIPGHPTTIEITKGNTLKVGHERSSFVGEFYNVYDFNGARSLSVEFHEGCNPETQLNGFITEDLVAILHHRFTRYQDGIFACAENAEIVGLFSQIMDKMSARRLERMSRDVSGTHKV